MTTDSSLFRLPKCSPVVVRTGPADTLKIIFLISTILSLILWYYLSYNPRGKLLLIKVQDKIRNYNLERLRRHLK